ncbi:MAG: heparinase II/III family protein [Proteobacteria bacterium]|nr:heparinase II/III family protein [Pseudomonadota bacterium]
MAVARTSFGADAEIAVFRCGPTAFRPDVERGHLHADALSVLWQVGADEVLVDPGTYLYSEGAGWRAWLRGTSSHSCVVIDECDQADVRTHRFGIAGEQPSRWESFAGDATQMTAVAEHPAHGTPRVRRRVAWIAGGTLVLCDDVAGDGEHRLESWLQFPSTEGDADGNAVLLRLASGRPVLVQGFGDITSLEVLRPARDADPGPGWRAPRYGSRTPGTSLRFDAGTRSLPARLVLLMQVGDAHRTPEPVRVESDGRYGLRVFAGRHAVRFDGARAAHIETHA